MAPPRMESTSDINKRLRKEFRSNMRIIRNVGRLGKILRGSVVDPLSLIDAERQTANDAVTRRYPDSFLYYYFITNQWGHISHLYEVIDDYFDAQAAAVHDRFPHYWDEGRHAADLMRHEIADSYGRIRLLETRLQLSKYRRDQLNTVEDARSAEERQKGEPPHPPYREQQETDREIKRIESDLAFERRLINDLEERLRKLEKRLANPPKW